MGEVCKGSAAADRETDKLAAIQAVYEAWKDCKACPLHEKRTQIVLGGGNVVTPKVLVIGEAPGPEEDRRGIPFIGPTGQLLRTTMRRVGIDPDSDCFFTNSVICFPTNDGKDFRGPTGPELKSCRPRFEDTWNIIKDTVKVVLLTGKRAIAQVLMRDRIDAGGLNTERDWNDIKINKMIGWYEGEVPNGYPRIHIIYHPSFIMRSGANDASKLFVSWKQQLKQVADYIRS